MMNEDVEKTAIPKAIRGLAAAVWCLAGVLLAFLAFYALALLRPQALFGQRSSTGSASRSGITSTPMERPSSFEPGFPSLMPEEKIKKASAILVTSWKREGATAKAVVTEIVKQKPGTRLYYSVGDEYSHFGAEMPREVYGDGEVVLMVGSPAEMRESYSFEGGRIGGLGDMPLTKLRELAKQSQ